MKRKSTLLFAIVLVISILFSACGAPKEVTVGVMVQQDDARFTNMVWGSASMAADEWNANPDNKIKINLKKIEYPKDIDGTKKVFDAAVKDMKPVAILGSMYSSTVLGINDNIKAAGIPYLTAASNEQITHNGNDQIFRVQTSDSTLVKIATKYIVKTLGKKKIAVLYADNAFGQGAAKAVSDTASQLGATVVKSLSYNIDTADMKNQIAEIKNSGADFLIAWPYTKGGDVMLKELSSQGVTIPFVGNSALSTAAATTPFSARDEGSLVVTAFVATSSQKDWVSKIEGKLGKGLAGAASASYYDGANMLFKTIAGMNGSITPDTVNKELKKQDYEGVAGEYKFDSNGEGLKQVSISQIKNGKLQFLKIEVDE